MQILFVRWCLDPAGRTPVAVNPARVDCLEQFGPAFRHGATGEEFPAATKVIMKGKQEYIVQGDVADVQARLHADYVIRFGTLEQAKAVAEDIFAKTGVVVAIERA
jgi:hypothetical protein